MGGAQEYLGDAFARGTHQVADAGQGEGAGDVARSLHEKTTAHFHNRPVVLHGLQEEVACAQEEQVQHCTRLGRRRAEHAATQTPRARHRPHGGIRPAKQSHRHQTRPRARGDCRTGKLASPLLPNTKLRFLSYVRAGCVTACSCFCSCSGGGGSISTFCGSRQVDGGTASEQGWHGVCSGHGGSDFSHSL